MAIGTTTAILGAGLLGAGGAYLAGKSQEKGIKEASKTTAKAEEKATKAQLEMYYQSRKDILPYMELGKRTIPKYEATLGVKTSPLYKWELEEGQKAIDTALAKRGLFSSGAALETHRRFAKELTAKYGYEAYQKYLDAMKIGTGAAGQAGLWGTQAGGTLAQLYGQTGANLAQLEAAKGTSQAQMWSGLAGAPMAGLGTYMNYEMMNRMFPKTSGSLPGGGYGTYGADYSRYAGGGTNVSFLPEGQSLNY